jgi:signal transduction histidine kinase
MGYVELLLLELDGPLTEGQRGILDRIRQSQRHLLSLIEDVLGFAQVEAGRLSFTLQPVVVRDALASIEPMIAHESAKKGLTLHIGETDSGLVAYADPGKLRQILLNLITNAIKFTPDGGSISVVAEPAPDSVVIKISDTGIGISPDNLKHVFEPFFQVDQGGTRRYPGVGLGLAIVDKGTTVLIKLPSAESRISLDEDQLTPKAGVADSSTASPVRAVMQP